MSQTFARHGDVIRMRLADAEVELLTSLRDSLHATLSGAEPDDAVMRRLFPAAVRDDEEADADLRGMLRDDLLASRLEALDALVELLGRGSASRGQIRVDLVDDEPLLVLGVVNDLRLAIGARIDIERIDRGNLAPDAPVLARLAMMDHLAWWQEQLLAILDPEAAAHAHDD